MSQMLDYIVSELKRTDVEEVARATEISVWTLRKIRIGAIDNPGIRSAEPLYKYLKKAEGKRLRRRA
jgi:hypothetical protein